VPNDHGVLKPFPHYNTPAAANHTVDNLGCLHHRSWSTLPQQQASVTLNRPENTAPQDQTLAQAYRTPWDMH